MENRYEELCTLCYQHTLDPGAVAVKRAATEIGGGGPPSRTNDRTPNNGTSSAGGDDGLASPPSSLGHGSGVFRGGSFSSLNSPGHSRRDSSGSGVFSRSGAGSPSGGGGSSPKGGGGGGNSPVNRGKQFFAKHLRM